MAGKAIQFNGVNYPSMVALCRVFEMNAYVVRTRIRRGWPLVNAITTPTHGTVGNTYRTMPLAERLATGTKPCSDCKKVLPFGDFPKRSGTQDGLYYYCRPCHRKRTQIQRYGAVSGDSCEVCGSENKPVVDHDHNTGTVRGTLCSRCNVAIGMLDDDPMRLRALADYLERN